MKKIKQILTQYNTDVLINTSEIFLLITRLTKKDSNVFSSFINRSYLKRNVFLHELTRFALNLHKFSTVKSFYAFLDKKANWKGLSNVLGFNFYEWVILSSTSNVLFFNFFKLYKQIFNFLNFSCTSAYLIKNLNCLN